MSYSVFNIINAKSNIQINNILLAAFEYFGEFTSILEFKEVHITDRDTPMIFYPYRDKNEVIIHLTQNVIGSPQEYIYQLSHEIAHTLFANKEPANNLEEGLCTYFSLECIKKGFGINIYNNYRCYTLLTHYAKPLILVEKMINWNNECIKIFRAKYPTLKNITANSLKEISILSLEEMTYLCEKF
ncbi:MAG: hypothetical protein CVV57_01655 [Tenericutes bacterium HGW-Tenericutes-2]|jgi:hypothetical protein|nr:MAG: hypothetical protein CVV57_01655 [Tenericutes bacterium HGW-Tenericutes-2]